MEPLEVLSSLSSPVQCLAACLLKSPRCKAFAFGNRSCDLLQRSPCDSQRPMRDAPGFALYDVLTRDRMTLTKEESPDWPLSLPAAMPARHRQPYRHSLLLSKT
ncbi:hypothetical protein MRX96_045898 [Rhipicephalus microplus]